MKHTLLCIVILLTNSFLLSSKAKIVNTEKENGGSSDRVAQVDQSDTVIFDLSQSVINGNEIEFPVYFHSDDIVNALDFSFRFNQLNFSYDSIINLTHYLQVYSFYNTNDSTLRFTSNSLSAIGNDTPLVMLRFISTGGQLCSGDLNTINAYLNGDPCSFKLVSCVIAGLNETMGSEDQINIFPNPTNDRITIECPDASTVQICDLNGKAVLNTEFISEATPLHMNLESLSNGIYLARIFNEKQITLRKIILSR
ncbi:MAG TPA: T9SS type A sorting domain-containing protein [Bacteroidia bacterium]|nr:T9SS type A sorting domain-containing protein [Bacteroidia bacterium]